jgi:hypothetical protein
MSFVNGVHLLRSHSRVSENPSPLQYIEWLECVSTSHPKPTLNQHEIEWSSLPTLHEGSGGRNEVAPLMTPKSVTMWAHTLLHHGERFKVVE